MEPRVLVCVFLTVFACHKAYAQVGSLCRPNEQLLECGCPKTCRDPAPACVGVCRTGCFCDKDQVRNDEGLCVDLADCPPIEAALTQDTTEPRDDEGKCPKDEEYRFCEPCAGRSCANPNPVCPAQCARGCFCVEGLLRNDKKQCVKPDQCQLVNAKNVTTTPQPIVYQMTCNIHQVYKDCETCERTCNDPNPKCPTPCQTGCFCQQDYVKGPDGQCVKLEKCPEAKTPQPLMYQMTCNSTQVYKECETCERNCTDPNPKCDLGAPCHTGCFCKQDYVKGPHGQCVKLENCPATIMTTTAQPMVYQMTCNAHQVYKECETCGRTCSDPNPKCPTPCQTGCFCQQDYVKGPDGQCVKLENCPKAEMTFAVRASPSIEDCAPDEVYFSCGWCEPSCSHPKPMCPNKVCTMGCLCRPPLLRHHSGYCVEEKDCAPQKCHHQNEEYVCRYGCELRCEPRRFYCAVRTRRCVLGCHCKLGYYRDRFTGHCVTKEQCTNATVSGFTAIKDTIFSVFNYSEPDVTTDQSFHIRTMENV